MRSAVATLEVLQQVVAAADALRGRRTTLVFISELAKALALIDAESRGYYLLTYASPAPDDDKFHSIEVRVNVPNLHVRARKGYVRTAAPVVR